MIDIEGKLVIVTGGAGLLGKSFARTVALNKGIAVIADIDENNGKEVVENLRHETQTTNIIFHQTDTTNRDSFSSLTSFLDAEYGSIDALVNCANPRTKNFWDHFFDVEIEDFNKNIAINLGSYFLCSQQMAKYFQKQGHGNIINIASIYGVMVPRFDVYEGTRMTMPVSYAAIKSALIHLTKYMAKYFKGMNIRVNAISPGGIFNEESEIFQKNYKRHCSTKGMLDKEDLQGTLLFLLSEHSRYINGQNIVVDDGYSL